MKKNILLLVAVVVLVSVTIQGANALEDVDYVTWYTFDDDLTDFKNVNNATNSGSTNVTGKISSGRHTTGNSNYVQACTNSCIDLTGDWMIGFWIYPTSLNRIMGVYYDATNKLEVLVDVGVKSLSTRYNDGGTGRSMYKTNTVGTGTWSHIVFGFNQSSNTFLYYVNGTEITGLTTGGTTATIVGTDVKIGSDGEASVSTVDWDEWFFTNQLLSAANISEIYNSGTGAQPPFTAGSPPVSNATDAYYTEGAFSSQFTDRVSFGAAYGTAASSTFVVNESAQQTYFTSTVTTNSTGATTTANCRINVDGSFYGSTRARTITTGTLGNFRLTTTNATLGIGNHTVSTECQKSGGAGFDVVGTTITGHLLYDVERDTNITYLYNETGDLSLPTTGYTPVHNFTFSTGQNWNSTSTNTLHLLTEWRATATYTTAGNISAYVVINGTICGNYTRYGGAGSTGSIAGVCIGENYTNGTDYTIQLYAKGDGSLDTQFHTKELIAHTSSVNNTNLFRTNITSNSLVTLNQVTITNLLGGTYNIMMTGGVNVQTNSTGTTANIITQLSTPLRDNLRTLSNAGQPGNLLVEGIAGTSGTSAQTLEIRGSCVNSNCMVNDGDYVAYVTDATSATDNTFNVTAYNHWNGTGIQVFNVTIGGASISTTTGTIEIVTNDTNPTVLIEANEYFSNTTVHDRTLDLNASLVKFTKVIVQQLDSTLISNFTAYVNSTGQQNTTDGNLFLEFSAGSFNISVQNISHNGIDYADQEGVFDPAPYLESVTLTVLLSNTFNVSFRDEITDLLITENVSLQVISAIYANNYTVTNTSQFNVSLLTPSEYTLRYKSDSYQERDYIVQLTNGTFHTIDLYMITINESSDVAVTVEDTGGDRVENATVTLLRYFVTCNCYKTVEMSKTSASGEAVFWVQAIEGFYKWSVNFGSVNEFLSTSPENILTDTRVFTINLGDDFYESFEGLTTTARTLSYLQSTGALTFTWSDPNGLVSQGCLEAEYVNGTRWNKLGASCVTGATGSVILMLDNTTRYKYRGYVETTTTYSDHTLVSGWIDNIIEGYAFGTFGSFLAIGVVMGLSLLFSFSAIAVLVVNVVAIVAISWMGIMSFQTSFIVGLAALTLGFALYLMRR